MKRSLFVFGFLTDSDVEWLASASSFRQYATGETLIAEGARSERLIILIDGAADVSIRGRHVATVSSGEIVGEISLLDSRPPSATVTANEPTITIGIPFETLRARLKVDPEFSSRLYYSLGVLLSQRMRETLGGQIEDADEINPDVMEQVAVAGRRLELLKERAMERR